MPDPYLEIRGGPGHPDPEIRWEGGRSPNFFSALWASVWSRIKGGRSPRAPPLDPPLGRKDGVEVVRDVRLKSCEKARAFLTGRLPPIEQNNPLIFFFHNYGWYKATHKELPNLRC